MANYGYINVAASTDTKGHSNQIEHPFQLQSYRPYAFSFAETNPALLWVWPTNPQKTICENAGLIKLRMADVEMDALVEARSVL